jgi:hypothetical protein
MRTIMLGVLLLLLLLTLLLPLLLPLLQLPLPILYSSTPGPYAAREGVHRFDKPYAAALPHTLHAPLPLPSNLPPASVGGGTTFLGVPHYKYAEDAAAAVATVVFEHRPFLAEGVKGSVVADRPMAPRRLAADSQKRVLVSSPTYLAQFDRADRLRVLQNCARWLHPSQGLLVLRFLNGGDGLQKWIARRHRPPTYHCRATIAVGDATECGVWHVSEAIIGEKSSTSTSTRLHTYASLLFVDAASIWALQVRRAGLEVVAGTEGDEDDGSVVWICRRAAAA